MLLRLVGMPSYSQIYRTQIPHNSFLGDEVLTSGETRKSMCLIGIIEDKQ